LRLLRGLPHRSNPIDLCRGDIRQRLRDRVSFALLWATTSGVKIPAPYPGSAKVG
jgi:hypothetical protein